jgi:Replication-relaxation
VITSSNEALGRGVHGPSDVPVKRSEEMRGDPGGNPARSPAGEPATSSKARRAGAYAPVAAGRAASRGENRRPRLLKGSSALQPPTRRRSADLRWRITQALTDRDRLLLDLLERFRVLTTPQVARLFFDSHKRASARLLDLYDVGVLDRFRPHRPDWGSYPWHWVLGPLGAAVLACERGDEDDRAARRWRPERTLAYATGQRLAHLVGANDFYVGLAAHARHHAEASLADWMTEAEAGRWSDGLVRPDGWGIWEEAGRSVEFFVEYDRGTETLGRLVDKLGAYERFEAERGVTAWVLFAFTSARRERSARVALAASTVPVATAALVDAMSPAGSVWRPPASDSRMRLAELAGVPKAAAAIDRAGESVRAWKYERPVTDDR